MISTPPHHRLLRRIAAMLCVCVIGGAGPVRDETSARPVRALELISRPQAEQPQEFQTAQLVAREWRRLGLVVTVRTMPWEKMADRIWKQRDGWDAATWPMVGRPERSDPDELVYNLYHSSTARAGYNVFGYQSPAMDRLLEAQRRSLNRDKRRALLGEIQRLAQTDQPAIMLVHPKTSYAYDRTIWDPASIVEQSGVGIKNFWTFLSARPLGQQRDLILRFADRMKSINPLWITGDGPSTLTELVWDRLMRVAPDGRPVPWAAASVTRLDSITYRIVLRQNMRWHDGRPVRIEDVIFSFEAIMSGEAPQYQPLVSTVASITKTGPGQADIRLSTPTAAFETATLAKVNIIPRHVWEPMIEELRGRTANVEDMQEAAPVGSGPYRFVSWRRGQEVVLARNAEHFNPPQAARLIVRIVPNTEAAVGMLRAGEVNFLTEYSGDPGVLRQFADRDGDIGLVSTTDIGSRFIALNQRRAPFNDRAFRRALSKAIDRRLIVAAAYRGAAIPAHSLVSPALPAWHAPADSQELSTGLDLARDILTDAGYFWVGGRLHGPGAASPGRGS